MSNRKDIAKKNNAAKQAQPTEAEIKEDIQDSIEEQDHDAADVVTDEVDPVEVEKDNVVETPQKVTPAEKLPDYVLVMLKDPKGICFRLKDGSRLTINGNATHLKGLPQGVLPDNGYGITRVLRTDWEYIKKTYGQMKIFENKLIFASNDKASAKSMMKEHDEVKSGLEPVKIGDEASVNELAKVNVVKKK